MDMHEFEQWCARRDPLWFVHDAEELFDWLQEYTAENGLEVHNITSKYFFIADIRHEQKEAQRQQLCLFKLTD